MHDREHWVFLSLDDSFKGVRCRSMTNGDSGRQLIGEIEARVAAAATGIRDKPVFRYDDW